MQADSGCVQTASKRTREDAAYDSSKSPEPPLKRREQRLDELENVLEIPSRQLGCDDYTVGWICTLPHEMAAATAMLDEIHVNPEKPSIDNNTYTVGNIRDHNVAIACLSSGVYGTTSATVVASQMKHSFRSIEFWLMVGIGGGAPSPITGDIRLGDVVVSIPKGEFDGVVQYDYGKVIRDGVFQRIGVLNKPPLILLTAVSKLRSENERDGSLIPRILSKMKETNPRMSDSYDYPSREEDMLFEEDYEHETGDTCARCDKERLVARDLRCSNAPKVHYGLIASGNKVIKHGRTRAQLARDFGIICFEMEAAGLMDKYPCIVIRGISDYCDSHKNDNWQRYAAATAAAYTKELLFWIPSVTTAIKLTNIQDVDPTECQSLVKALKFDQMDDRQMGIKNAHHKTCRWLLTTTEYISWLDLKDFPLHNGFLWLKGKAGSGKSTLMKFALQHTQRSMSQGSVIISFFFHARGDTLENTTLGMYRSLLLQLLEKARELQRNLLSQLDPPKFQKIKKGGWTIEILKELFFNAIQDFERECLICFIDALDECGQDEIRDMVKFFENFAQLGVSSRKRLHICFASRYYPYISMEKGQELIVENADHHQRDISQYLRSELKIGQSKLAEQIKCDILEKASGVFLWVYLVVQIVQTEYDDGRRHKLRKRLQEIPTELGELFKDILTRDTKNINDLLLCLQWILYARRPLKREELFFAVLSGENDAVLTMDDITTQDMDKFISSCTKGLAEVSKSKTGSTVQFIHESVRDFLLKETALNSLWPESYGDLTDSSHERLKVCCYNYLELHVESVVKFLAVGSRLPMANTSKAAKLREKVIGAFPFLPYAVRNVFHHSDNAEKRGISQEEFIKNLPLKKWIHYSNLLQMDQGRRRTPSASPLYLFSELDLPYLIAIQLKKTSDMDIEGERHGYPISAALAHRNEKAIRALLVSDTKEEQTYDDQEEISAGIAELIARGHEFQPQKRQTLLSYAADNSYLSVMYALLATRRVEPLGINLKLHRELLFSSATRNRNVPIMTLLIDNHLVDLELKDNLRSKQLIWAAAKGHDEVVKLLLEKGAHLEAKRDHDCIPLIRAVKHGHETVVSFPLDASAKDNCLSMPLIWAARKGHGAVVTLLIDKGADLESKDDTRFTPLLWAARNGHHEVVRVLLDNGADREVKDGLYDRTPETWARENGHALAEKVLKDRRLVSSEGQPISNIL